MSTTFRFSIIGSGNTAHFLAYTLQQQGHILAGIWARDAVQATLFAANYQCSSYQNLGQIPDQKNHICFMAISDVAIAVVAEQLSFSHTLLVHCSGATAISVLYAAAQNTAVYWPIYAITKGDSWDSNIIPIAIEASNLSGQEILVNLSPKVFLANGDTRKHLHLAAVFASNFTNHLYAISQQICTQHQLDAKQTLAPIINQSISRLAKHPAIELQTGPAIRNDQNTLHNQQNLLQNQPYWLAIYQSLSASIRNTYTLYDD